jgi:hypothetical protein
MKRNLLLCGVGRVTVLMHRMVETGAGVVVDLMRQHRPNLPRMLVGDGDDHLAEQHAPVECAYPKLFGRGLFGSHSLGALQAAARALNQQRAQVGITATADLAQSCMPATGMLRRYQAKPCGHLPPLFEFVGVADGSHRRVGGDRADADDRAQPDTALVLSVRDFPSIPAE